MLLFLVVLFALLGAGAFFFEAAKGPAERLVPVGLVLLALAVACLGAWHLHVLGKI